MTAKFETAGKGKKKALLDREAHLPAVPHETLWGGSRPRSKRIGARELDWSKRRLKRRPAVYEKPVCPHCKTLLDEEVDGQGRIRKVYCPNCGVIAIERIARFVDEKPRSEYERYRKNGIYNLNRMAEIEGRHAAAARAPGGDFSEPGASRADMSLHRAGAAKAAAASDR